MELLEMEQNSLSDSQWQMIKHLLPGKKSDRGVTADNRKFLNAVIWVLRTGAPWRNLPDHFGNWHSVYTRFIRWGRRGVWEKLFKAISKDPNFENLFIDTADQRDYMYISGGRGNSKFNKL